MLTSKGLWTLVAAYSSLGLATAFFVYPPLILSLLTITIFLAVYMVQTFTRLASISTEKVVVERQVTPPTVTAGQTVNVVLHFSNRMGETLDLELEDIYEGLVLAEGSATTRAMIKPGETMTMRYLLKAVVRGEYTVGPTIVRVYDGPGLLVRKIMAGKPVKVVASPAMETRPKLGESLIRSRVGVDGSGVNPLSGADEIFRQVKPYTEGEPVRRIAWRRTARNMDDEILVKQYEHFSSIGIGLILDCSPSMMVGSPPLLDRCLSTILALLSVFLRKGDIVHIKTLGAVENISLRATSYSTDYVHIISAVSSIRPGAPYTPPGKMEEFKDLDLVFILSRFTQWSGGDLSNLLRSLRAGGSAVFPICPVIVSYRPGRFFNTLIRLEDVRLRHLRERVPQLRVFPENSLLPQILNLYRLHSGRSRSVEYV